ncbi:MAG: Nuclease SbcCD, D subunit [candidate division TM6 bacterium GW2011_GWF2_38_10]|nr:MAG: Nuclease SbcCD, D subunit [candidate division TM6 bacterium GW2011_GWF2_38_10]
MITFYHTADLHFGVENYGKIDVQTGIHTRLLDFKKTLECCVEQAINENVDFFLFCGDAYKTPVPTPTHQKILMTQLLRLYHAKIPVVIVVGNHDHPLSFGKSHALDVFDYLPVDGFYVIAKPSVISLATKHGLVNIVGVPWPTRNIIVSNQAHRFKSNDEIAQYLSARVGDIITTLAASLDPAIPAVLAGHLTVSTGIFSGSEKSAIYGSDPVFLPSQLAIAPFDYVALGHLHRYQNLNVSGYPAVVYSGSLERVDFGERKEEKGYCRVTIATQSQVRERCEHEFVPVQTRPMIQLEIKLDAERDFTKQLIEHIALHDLTGAIVKIVYHVPDNAVHTKVDFYEVNRACVAAHHVVGVFPIYRPAVKERRALLSVQMDLDTLLATYFDAKQISGEKKDRLFAKARQLIVEQQNEVTVE